jgi:hypothetical protein
LRAALVMPLRCVHGNRQGLPGQQKQPAEQALRSVRAADELAQGVGKELG